MGNKETIHSHYHIDLATEINRMIEQLKEIGIKNPTKLEVTSLIAEKNKRAKLNTLEVREFFAKLRGLQ